MTANPLVWITARDGSVHATLPPIVASGQPMLCTRSFGRLDLRVRAQPNAREPEAVGTCPRCRSAAGDLAGTPRVRTQ